MGAEKDKLTPIISKSGTENQFVCRWGKSCLDHLPGIRCHSVTKCSAARTMNVNFWEPVWKHVSLVQRGRGAGGKSFCQSTTMIDCVWHSWLTSVQQFPKIVSAVWKNSHTCSGYQTNCMWHKIIFTFEQPLQIWILMWWMVLLFLTVFLNDT